MQNGRKQEAPLRNESRVAHTGLARMATVITADALS